MLSVDYYYKKFDCGKEKARHLNVAEFSTFWRKFTKIYTTLDADGSGEVDFEELMRYLKICAHKMRVSKVGLNRKAKLLFSQADEDDSGQLSIIEIFCILPSIEQMLKNELRPLGDDEMESCSEHYSESEDEVSVARQLVTVEVVSFDCA